jgi:hypothetical protein
MIYRPWLFVLVIIIEKEIAKKAIVDDLKG